LVVAMAVEAVVAILPVAVATAAEVPPLRHPRAAAMAAAVVALLRAVVTPPVAVAAMTTVSVAPSTPLEELTSHSLLRSRNSLR
jgi:hypothetical protein